MQPRDTIKETEHEDIEAYANAEFIVRACNSHDAMVEALQLARETLKELSREAVELVDVGFPESLNDKWNELGYGYETLQAIDAALAAAGVTP